MSGYTVIDFETTGLSPRHNDRVVEIGVVYVSHDGEIQGSWETLVNPGRDVGPTHIHGISAREVLYAPTFEALAPYVLRAVAGRTVVAHNAPFDMRFLHAELARAGLDLRDVEIPALCTMQWVPRHVSTASRRLHDCCRAMGVEHRDAHSALGDALATAGLLSRCLGLGRLATEWRPRIHECQSFRWPDYYGAWPDARMVARSSVPPLRGDDWMGRLVDRLPHVESAEAESYLAILDEALIDHYLSEHEQAALLSVAQDLRLGREQVRYLHTAYLNALADAALEDGVVTEAEKSELQAVAQALGLESSAIAEALERVRVEGDARDTAAISLRPGDRVVFTGEMSTDRAVWYSRARAAGLDPGGVTRKTRVVVAADPDSLSGKGRKAREYGVPIVTEAFFERLLQEHLERECQHGHL